MLWLTPVAPQGADGRPGAAKVVRALEERPLTVDRWIGRPECAILARSARPYDEPDSAAARGEPVG